MVDVIHGKKGSAMSIEFTSALDDEIANLERELEQDVRYVRLRELKRLRQLYGKATSSQSVTHAEVQRAASEQDQPRHFVRRTSTARERALAAAKEYIGELNRIVPTREVLEHLATNGIEVGGATPLNNLSAMISTSGIFESHGRRGWTIRKNYVKSRDDEERQEENSKQVHSKIEDDSQSSVRQEL